MTRVVVLGQSYWGRRVAAALHDPARGSVATFVPEHGYLMLLAARAVAPEIVVRVGYRVGGTTTRARAFDAFWAVLRRRFPRSGGAHYWLGTDVLNTLEEAAARTLRRSVVAASREDLHVVDAEWLADELQTVGLHAATAHVPQPYHAPDAVPALPPRFTVLTYLPGDRFAYYGGEATLEAARRLPDVSFQVVGRVGVEARAAPPNVVFLGWVHPMDAIYQAASVVVRVPRHDGFGATVIEGLLNGRHVIYTHAVPTCRLVWPVNADGLTEALSSLRDDHAAGILDPNTAGRDYARQEFDAVALVERLRHLVIGAT